MSQQLGFEDFVAEVEESNKDFKQAQKVCLRALCLVPCVIGRVTDLTLQERVRSQPDTKGMTEEELLELQERLFASSHARFAAGQ